jgi:hypothetical protein
MLNFKGPSDPKTTESQKIEIKQAKLSFHPKPKFKLKIASR